MKKTYKIEVDCANCANLMEGRHGERPVRLQESGARLRDLPVSGTPPLKTRDRSFEGGFSEANK